MILLSNKKPMVPNVGETSLPVSVANLAKHKQPSILVSFPNNIQSQDRIPSVC